MHTRSPFVKLHVKEWGSNEGTGDYMSFGISMEFLGLTQMQKEIERLSTESELKALNKKIVKKAGEIGQKEAKSQIKKKAYPIPLPGGPFLLSFFVSV